MNNLFNKLIYGKSNKADYTKEAIKSESRLKLFFDILGVKYVQLIKINLVLLVCMIPLILWSWLSFSATVEFEYAERSLYSVFYAAGLIPCLLLLSAPLAGMTYIIKNFTQDKHVWLWKDFVAHTKSNAKQATLYALVYGIALFLGQVILYAYNSIIDASYFILILRAIYILIYVFVIVSVIYAFPLMVTYKLKLRHVIKNSLLLTMGSLPTTFLAPVLALLPFALFLFISTVWGYGLIFLLFYSLLFGVSFALYIIVSFTTAVFAKHLDKADNDETNQDVAEQKQ